MFELYADKNRLVLRKKEPVTSGSVNVYPVRFAFSADWDGLEKAAVFRAGDSRPKRAVWKEENLCEIPWEVLIEPRVQLYAGVYGHQGNRIVLPTQWAYLGTVQEGAEPGEAVKPPPDTPGGDEGTSDHRKLSHREDADQHPISAISDLAKKLDNIPAPVEPLTNQDLEELLK